MDRDESVDDAAKPYVQERRQRIASIVEQAGRAAVSDLAGRFRVSEVTIRKDLAWLEAEQQLVRTHGGAIKMTRHRSELAFEVRERLQRAEKVAIGAAAAALVNDGDSIALDASTTALEVARHLQGRMELTVITNGMHIARELAGQPGITVLMPGGRLRWEAMSLVGGWGEHLLRRVNIQKAFLGGVGLTLEEGLTDVTEDEAEIKRAMGQAAHEVIAIVDHSKWGRAAFATFLQASEVDLVITDVGAPQDQIERMERLGARVTAVRPDADAPPPSRRA
ncbi:MAG TPA: DeoR/GlpR family DNA-binding transcription regulator [Candidatus Dormibacteraeota bacterium]|nr:DeoR/GlpR family DNA-binding transcription regulator [Candidatus Dormibacteraeota bacterium]